MWHQTYMITVLVSKQIFCQLLDLFPIHKWAGSHTVPVSMILGKWVTDNQLYIYNIKRCVRLSGDITPLVVIQYSPVTIGKFVPKYSQFTPCISPARAKFAVSFVRQHDICWKHDIGFTSSRCMQYCVLIDRIITNRDYITFIRWRWHAIQKFHQTSHQTNHSQHYQQMTIVRKWVRFHGFYADSVTRWENDSIWWPW